MPVSQGAIDTNKINKESEELMRWSKEYLSHPERFNLLKKEIEFKLKMFFAQPDRKIIQSVMSKLLYGAREHGKPIYDSQRLKQEFEFECIDLIGWTMVEKWNMLKMEQQFDEGAINQTNSGESQDSPEG